MDTKNEPNGPTEWTNRMDQTNGPTEWTNRMVQTNGPTEWTKRMDQRTKKKWTKMDHPAVQVSIMRLHDLVLHLHSLVRHQTRLAPLSQLPPLEFGADASRHVLVRELRATSVHASFFLFKLAHRRVLVLFRRKPRPSIHTTRFSLSM